MDVRSQTRVATLLAIAAVLPISGVAPCSAAAQSAPSQRVVTLFKQGDYAAAKAAVSNGAATDAQSLYYLGRIAVIEDRTGDAVSLLERAIKADGRNSEYHEWLGIALGLQARESGRFRQAMLGSRAKGEFERAVSLDPRNVGAREGLVQFFSVAPGIAGGSVRRAREQADEIAKISPMRGHLARGLVHEREKALDAAEREYREAASVSPDSAAPLMALGALYQRMEKWDDAFDAYERALALPGIEFPEALSAHYQFGRTGALSGLRLDDSERQLKRWMDRAPKGTSDRRIGRTRSRLGMVYTRQGRVDLARTEFETALRLNAKDEDAKEGLAKLGR
jgi:tetratricopeptide (TPR) repeat protein